MSATEPLLEHLRSRYLDSLSEFQDFRSEFLNRSAHHHFIGDAGEPIGYALTDGAGMLLEFYVTDERRAEAALAGIVNEFRLERALCKTFDPLLLSLCVERAVRARPIAVLFRTIVDETFSPREDIAVRLAEASDLKAITAIDDGFFHSDEEIRGYIGRRQLFVYEQARELIGAGLAQPVVVGRQAYDVGMLVKPSRRRQGIGEYIVRHLKAHCLSEGFRPICGCSIKNAASRACLEAAGFRSRHRTIEFTWSCGSATGSPASAPCRASR
jgi:GNAT superfamily N-acetyltransferase